MAESLKKTLQHDEILGRAKNEVYENKQRIQFIVIWSIMRTGWCWSNPT